LHFATSGLRILSTPILSKILIISISYIEIGEVGMKDAVSVGKFSKTLIADVLIT
jgi:hypothetical protein